MYVKVRRSSMSMSGLKMVRDSVDTRADGTSNCGWDPRGCLQEVIILIAVHM